MRQVHSIIALTFGFVLAVCNGGQTDWCSTLLRCKDGKNTLCAFGNELADKGKCSHQEDLIQTDKGIKAYWLALHNTFRDQVAAGFVRGFDSASNMMQLAYNDLLTVQARRWAFQCRYEDDPCSRSPVYSNLQPEIVYNETLLVGDLVNKTRAAVFTRFLEDINGYHSFPKSLIDEFDADSFDDYHQVNVAIHAFAELRDIGASLVRYNWSEHNTSYPFLKSNTYYGPPIYKGPLYVKGKPCSHCPDEYRCNKRSTYRYLCAKTRDPTTDEYTSGLPGAQQKKNSATNPRFRLSVLLAPIHFMLKSTIEEYTF